MECQITLIPFFSNEPAWFLPLTQKLEEIFSLPVVRGKPLTPPAEGYDKRREQYVASRLLLDVCNMRRGEGEIALGITTEDIYEKGLNFVFGLASPIYRCALVSTRRLHNDFYGQEEDAALLFRRLLTESVHEIGHTLGLEHCPDPRCVMHFSNTLSDTDRKGYRFCPNCQRKVEAALAVCR